MPNEVMVARYCDVCDYDVLMPADEDTCPQCDSCTCENCQGSRASAADPWPADQEEEEGMDDGYRETVDADPALSFLLPNLPGRDIRTMSFEQEVCRGYDDAANELCELGFAEYPSVLSYGSSRPRQGDEFVHVEHDSSCGGEIIYSMLDLSDPADAARFGDAFGCVYSLHRSNVVELSTTCGFHIHVDLRGFGMGAIENLYHLHSSLEDVLYRLGSAGWIGHRSIVGGSTYANVTRKGLKGKSRIGTYLSNSRDGLNLSNYLAARGHCHCGAFAFADWGSCTCDLPKPTAEFRWPNATTNRRKVHAYAALVQALVSAAFNAADGEYASLPVREFAGNRPAVDALECFTWMGENLELTGAEWASIAYCVSRSGFDSATVACVNDLAGVIF